MQRSFKVLTIVAGLMVTTTWGFSTKAQASLVAHWTMNDTQPQMLFNGGDTGFPADATGNFAGTTSSHYSGSGTPGSAFEVYSVAGKVGTAADFGSPDNITSEGHNAFASLAPTEILNHHSVANSTIGAWFNLDSIQPTAGFLNWIYLDSTVYGIGVNGDKLQLAYRTTAGWEFLTNSFALSSETWYYGAAVRDGNDLSILLIEENGNLYSNSSILTGAIVSDPSSPSYIGGFATQNNFGGIIDEVQVFYETLSENDILAAAEIPEPSSILLLGMASLIIMRRKYT